MHTHSGSEFPKPEFREMIDQKAKWQVDLFRLGREKGEQPTLQIKRFIEGIVSVEYHGRTLIELIQNAHDAQAKDSASGRIKVVLDETEGSHGTLYVANSGRPFTEQNFDALVNVAVSDKPPSEGIGNKGVGFKSVLQLSSCPEVYSRSTEDAPNFDGFSFRFGTPRDFANLAARWAPGEDGLAAELENNVSTLTVTIPLEKVPNRVTYLGDAGFCTVIRLPLRSEGALREVHGSLEEIRSSETPVHLFLDRIETLDLVTIGEDGADNLSLTRSVENIDQEHRLTRSRLQDGSEFIVARRIVPEVSIRGAIATTLEEGDSLPGWDQWEGDAEVVLALSTEGPLRSPRLYNFLPMGSQVKCPLSAYLQAPFFSSLDRRSLNEALPINALLLNEAAALAAELLDAEVAGTIELPPETLVDLGCWSQNHLLRLEIALEDRSLTLDRLPFLPSLEQPGRSRTSIATASFWDPDGQHFGPDLLKPEQLRTLIDPALVSDRVPQLKDLYRALGHGAAWSPSGDSLVEFAEACAAHLQSDDADPEDWAQFYDELAEGLPKSAPVAGALIVAGTRGLLHANGARRNPTVFFPPQRGTTEAAVHPPEAVADALAYVREDIPWQLDNQQQRHGREWLSNYVARFRTEEILRAVAKVMSKPGLGESDLLASLHYAFNVWRNARDRLEKDDFRGTQLKVPTASGWVPANRAYFGKGWAGDDAWVDEALTRLIRELGDDDALDGVPTTIVRAPSAWVDEENLDAMREFLEWIGVRHGLWPIEVERDDWWALKGEQLNNPNWIDADRLPGWVPAEMREKWLKVAECRPWKTAVYKSVKYRLTYISRLPGQSEWDSFSARAQEIYGELVLAGLDRWDDQELQARFSRVDDRDWAAWPSFVTTFLATARWFPSRQPGDRDSTVLASVEDAWWVEGDVPSYLPAPAPHLRRSVGSRAVTRLRMLGVPQWDAKDSAMTRINYLARLTHENGRWGPGTRTEYGRSWHEFLDSPSGRMPRGVLVERQGSVELVGILGEDETIYYAAPDSPHAALLPQLPLRRLSFSDRSLTQRVGRYLSENAPNRFKSVADAEIEVLHPEPSRQGALLDTLGDWFETLILLILSTQSDALSRGLKRLGQTAHRLRTMDIMVVDDFSTRVDGHEVKNPQNQTSCWIDNDSGTGTILVRNADGLTGIRLAEKGAEGIAQAVQAPHIFNGLSVALSNLREAVNHSTPTNADLAAALRLHESEVDRLQTDLGAVRPDTSVTMRLLAILAPEAALEFLDASDSFGDRSEVESWLEAKLGDAVEVATVLKYADLAHTPGPIEDGLVSLPDANERLRTLGLNPIKNAEAQEHHFAAFVTKNKASIVDRLRNRFYSKVMEDPTELTLYAELLELPDLRHDPAWSDVFWQVPEAEMSRRIDDWLSRIEDPEIDSALPSVDVLRKNQRRRMTGSLTSARDSIAAWCGVHEVPLPPTIDVISVSAQIVSSGYLDFGQRESSDFVDWLAAHGYWPETMPHTLNQRELDIGESDLKKARERKRREAEEAKRRKETITFEGREYTGEPDDLLELDEMVQATQGDVLPGEPPTFAALKDMPLPGPSTRPPGRTKVTRGTRATPSTSEKSQSIGRLGEIRASRWIESKFGLAREETWRSGFRNDIIGDGKGDDTLGYDFEVVHDDITYLIEVKATTGNDTSFELPQSEIRRALNLAPHERYTILFISNVLDSHLHQFHWLPNPFGPDRQAFRAENRTMRFTFDVISNEDQ